MDFNAIMTDLKKRNFKPIYLLMGEEPYFIDQVSNYIAEHALTEAEKSFNQSVFYGKDVDASTVDNAARRFPMMAQFQVIIVKEAQEIKKIEELQHYALKPSEKTILVINYKYKSVRKNTKLYKNIDKVGVVLESKKLYDNHIPKWIEAYLKPKNATMEPAAQMMLTEFLGTDLSKISNELDKLLLVVPQGTHITPAIVEQNIGISKDFNVFELQKALANRDVLKANRIANYFAENQKNHPLPSTMGALYNYFSKILAYQFLQDKSNDMAVASALSVSPYFVKDYKMAARNYNTKKVVQVIEILRETDVRSKGVENATDTVGDLLREMVYRIMH